MMSKPFAGALLWLSVLAAHAAGISDSDLKWDLSYQSALRDHPLDEREFMRVWPQRYAQATRQIHELLARYDGEPIEASLLIEKPDGHAGDPSAIWFVKTHAGAKACSFHPSVKTSCMELQTAKVDRLVRDVMAFRPLPVQADPKNVIDDTEPGKPVLFNYVGYVSAYIDGKSLQRPIALIESRGLAPQPGSAPELGRLDDAIARATLSDADFAARQGKLDAAAYSAAFADTVRRGDLRDMERLLDRAPDRGTALMAENDGALKIAAAAGQKNAVEFLLRRGSPINGGGSAALRAAVVAGDSGMVDFLLAKGASIDPPADPKRPGWPVSASALSEAVDAGDEKMAALLIRRGANVNIDIRSRLLTRAANKLNYDLVDLLLKNGAMVNDPDPDADKSALLEAAMNARWPGSAEQVIRRLLAAGADLNFTNRMCETAYSIAQRDEQVALQRALADMGADVNAAKRCTDIAFSGRSAGRVGTEAKARQAIADETVRLLHQRDYAGLEKLHARLNDDKVRTPSGVWGLAVFYAALRDHPGRSRDMTYWNKEDAQAAQWAASYPRSQVATIYQLYLLQNRALSFRGNGNYADIRKEDIEPMQQAIKEALKLYDKKGKVPMSQRDPVDGGWYHARLEILPYSELFDTHFSYAWEAGTRQFPDYHGVYFAAAFYSLPKWGGAPDAVERLARLASTGKGADRDAMYARVYWYLDQTEYHGKIFDNSMIDWNDMKTSFDALVRAYPDPWNLNAYAYFACKAGDYNVMSDLLKRIDEQLVFSVWGSNGGESEYRRCARNVGADTRSFQADLAARNKRLQGEQYNRLIAYAIAQRDRFRNEESLRALQGAADIGQKLWSHPGMRVYFHKARALDNLGRYDEEVQALQQGLKSQPGYSSALFQMGLAYEGLKRREEARAQFALAAARLREDLAAAAPQRTPEMQKEFDRIRKKLSEYQIVVSGL